MPRLGALATIPLATLLVTGAAALAQDDAGGDAASRIVPAAECTAEPRTLDELIAAASTEPAEQRQLQVAVPLGEPVEIETRDAVVATVRGVLACFNANDRLRSVGYMTDNGIRRFFGGNVADEASTTAFRESFNQEITPRVDADAIRLFAVTDVSRTAQGTIQAFVVINEPLLPPGGPETLLMEFVEVDGRILLDNYLDFSQPVPGGAGTPEASPAAGG